jgi:hypothetical protein
MIDTTIIKPSENSQKWNDIALFRYIRCPASGIAPDFGHYFGHTNARSDFHIESSRCADMFGIMTDIPTRNPFHHKTSTPNMGSARGCRSNEEMMECTSILSGFYRFLVGISSLPICRSQRFNIAME